MSHNCLGRVPTPESFRTEELTATAGDGADATAARVLEELDKFDEWPKWQADWLRSKVAPFGELADDAVEQALVALVDDPLNRRGLKQADDAFKQEVVARLRVQGFADKVAKQLERQLPPPPPWRPKCKNPGCTHQRSRRLGTEAAEYCCDAS